jgi:hypothetical protein
MEEEEIFTPKGMLKYLSLQPYSFLIFNDDKPISADDGDGLFKLADGKIGGRINYITGEYDLKPLMTELKIPIEARDKVFLNGKEVDTKA